MITNFRVIFHVDEMTKWNLVLANIKNLLDSDKDSRFVIEVVANSEAVQYYRNNDEHEAMDALSKKGVLFSACNNAMKTFGIKKTELTPYVCVVPAGITEIVVKQQLGYSYVKP